MECFGYVLVGFLAVVSDVESVYSGHVYVVCFGYVVFLGHVGAEVAGFVCDVVHVDEEFAWCDGVVSACWC